MPDSRTLIKMSQDRPVYLTSAKGEDDVLDWIQEPLVLLPFDPSIKSIIEGIYVEISEHQIISRVSEPNLNDEFAAWEAASDEALLNFENSLE